MSDFSLRALVREVSETSLSPDPGVIAAEVDRRIDESDCRDALRQALRMFVRQVMSEDRMRTRIAPLTAGGSVSPSWKVREVKAWQKSMRDRVHVGEQPTDWKFFGDCTAVDLTFAATERDEQSRRNAAKARQYREAARLLTEHDVTVVRDLPVDVLSRVLVAA